MTILLAAEDVSKTFATRHPMPGAHGLRSWLWPKPARVIAVDDVSLEIRQGETLGLVGESGCGKSTLGRLLLGLLPLSRGTVRFRGQVLPVNDEAAMQALRRHLQLVFQDPYASLSPRMNIRGILEEPLAIHEIGTRAERAERLPQLLAMVGLSPDVLDRYPHEFSGGQRQRIGIARALALQPSFLVCDEPISALDVSIQAQIVNLLMDLQAQHGLTYLFISHDLTVVSHLCDRVAVMYLGSIVELAPTRALMTTPRHPYTKALLSAIPKPDPTRRQARSVLSGDVPTPLLQPTGCAFAPRCPHPHKDDQCRTSRPRLRVLDETSVACHKA